MASLNKVILIGNLGRDPEVRFTQGGSAVANLNLATNEVWTDKSGQRQERTEWHKIVVWGKQAEIARDYLTKGRQIYVEGSLQTRQWEDKEGQKRYTTEVKCMRFLMLGGRGGEAAQAGAEGGAVAESPMPPDSSYSDDDIPF